MKYNVLNYLLGEGIRSVFKNKKSSAVALMTMCATMFIFGVFFAATQNINGFVNTIKEEQAIQVNIKRTATDEEVAQLKQDIEKIDGVATVTLRTKEQYLESLKENFKEKAYLLEEYEKNNIFSNAYIVTFKNLEKIEEIQSQIDKFESVNSTTDANKQVSVLLNVAKGIKLVTLGILVLLIIISVVIISNTIKLTVYARRREISIMKYVGATNNFIRFPFVVEGIIIGILSGALTILLVGGAYNLLTSQMMNSVTLQSMGLELVRFSDMFNLLVTVYLALGIGIGILGSTRSMKKYLEV
ncbi:MAG: ABC transporter permease [Clostridia bacterium]|nr:ABC transporter permease [Clostridia bacterium]